MDEWMKLETYIAKAQAEEGWSDEHGDAIRNVAKVLILKRRSKNPEYVFSIEDLLNTWQKFKDHMNFIKTISN